MQGLKRPWAAEFVPLVTALDCYFIDFNGLKEWFWEGKRRFAYDTTPGDNGSICRLVNIVVTIRVSDRSTNGGPRSTADTSSMESSLKF